MSGNATARRQLDAMTAEHGRPPRLGCELTAHRDLGLCAYCTGPTGFTLELFAWRLLAMAERDVPPQPRTLADDVAAGLHDRPHP